MIVIWLATVEIQGDLIRLVLKGFHAASTGVAQIGSVGVGLLLCGQEFGLGHAVLQAAPSLELPLSPFILCHTSRQFVRHSHFFEIAISSLSGSFHSSIF